MQALSKAIREREQVQERRERAEAAARDLAGEVERLGEALAAAEGTGEAGAEGAGRAARERDRCGPTDRPTARHAAPRLPDTAPGLNPRAPMR